ncbi:MAG: hypothetical protein ACO3CD_07005 [Candidatus Nanopelagicaceae bacterium]
MFENYDIFDREKLTLHCLITLQTPLSHIGEVSGNVSNLKTAKLLDFEGNPRSVFVYSGNAIRNGILRRVGVAAALKELGIKVNPDTHHTMFAGGRIDGGTASDMQLDKKIRVLLPWLSVLGTAKPTGVFAAKDAQMIAGRINVGSGYLVCYESAEYVYSQVPAILPPKVQPIMEQLLSAKNRLTSDPFNPTSVEDLDHWENTKAKYLPLLQKQMKTWTEYLTIDQTTRRDSTLDPNLLKFLPSENQNQLKGDSAAKEKKSDQMIASDRLIMPGAKLYSRWDLTCTQVEQGWIFDTLLKFSESPYIGGKGNRGNGRVHLDFWFQSGEDKGLLCSLKDGILSDRFLKSHQKYREYINQYQQFLSEAKTSNELRNLLGS